MDTSTPAWLTPPYYTPDPEVRIPNIPFYGSQPTAESMMQELTREILSWPQGFMFGANGSGTDAPAKLQAQMVAYATSLTQSPVANLTTAGFDPQVRGLHYFNVVQEALKRIPASSYNWMETRSVYDVWVKP